MAFTHGKVEAAIRLPKTANGLWPAFWMMGNDFDQVGWPKCGETDIMEFGHIDGINRGVQDRYFNGACHWGQSWNNHPNYARAVTYNYSLQDDEYHIYTCIWNQERIAMYVDLDKHPDAKPYYEMTIPATGDTGAPGYYFHKENFILFNLAVGGNFPNIWDAAGITALNAGNGNQASMYVNYVKVYQKGTADESLNTLSPGDEQGGASVGDVVAETEIAFDGNTVAVSVPSTICVYNINGSLVRSACGTEISVADLQGGVYIVKCGQATKKIVIR